MDSDEEQNLRQAATEEAERQAALARAAAGQLGAAGTFGAVMNLLNGLVGGRRAASAGSAGRGSQSSRSGSQGPHVIDEGGPDDDDDIQITGMSGPPLGYRPPPPIPAARPRTLPQPKVPQSFLNQLQELAAAERDSNSDRAELKCAICLSVAKTGDPLCSTICGHIFCEDCIKSVIANKVAGGKKCPICRKSLAGKNSIHRLYL